MKILMLTPYLPYPLLSGGQIRTYNLLKQLAKKHEITLFALIKDDSEKQHVEELEKYCTKVKVFKRSKHPFTLSNILKTAFSSYPFLVIRNHVPEVIKAVKKELSNTAYDVIHAETFYMMPHIPKTKVPILLVEQTIEYLGYESYAARSPKIVRPLLSIDITKIKRWETYYWKKCDVLISMSEEDKKYISSFIPNPQKVKVVANGVDTAWFNQKKAAPPNTPTVLSVGTFKWLPNVEAVHYLLDKVWPLVKATVKDAKLTIVGNEPTADVLAYAQEHTDITVNGRIPDIRDAFTKAHVLLAPVFSGKGTRYKVLEAMAAGTPIVATPTAVEGLDVQHGVHVMIGSTAEELSACTVELLNNTALREKLSRNGKEFVKKQFDWTLIANNLDTIYKTIGTEFNEKKS